MARLQRREPSGNASAKFRDIYADRLICVDVKKLGTPYAYRVGSGTGSKHGVRVLSKRREGKVPLAKSVCFGVQATRVEEIRLSYSSESEVKESREALPRSFRTFYNYYYEDKA